MTGLGGAVVTDNKHSQVGALDGGVLTSRVDLKKCQCRMSLNSSPVPCRSVKLPMSHVTIFFEPMSL